VTGGDCWTRWLATRRFGDDEHVRDEVMARLADVRDAVLDRAALAPGETLLDVGCGEGLIGFGALDRDASVVFSDVSQDLLESCSEAAESLGVRDRCRFVRASADDLSSVESESTDVVTTRSVLIYVKDKERAFVEFFRVLRPGGRISLYEPINRFACVHASDRFGGYEVAPVTEIAGKLRALFEGLQPDSDPMLDFDERDLVAACEGVGFFPIDLQLHAEIRPLEPRRWDTFVHTAGNPKIPTLAEAMNQALDDDERERLTAHLRPLVEAGQGTWRMAHTLLRADKPRATTTTPPAGSVRTMPGWPTSRQTRKVTRSG
jgi:ubiquinone/menaquinone biosynthesis C-methylase UbiE